MNILKITPIQTSLIWENIDSNLTAFSEQLTPLEGKTDIVVLPEMFTTGFSMNAASLAEEMNGKTMTWLRDKAQEVEAAICGSFIAKEEGRFYNRFVFMRPNGECSIYDKRHLFTLAKEHEVYSGGKEKKIIHYKGWKICPQVCYDVRFPVWSRNVEQYDLLIYVANFPAKRALAWKTLLQARAIENQVYTVGVNRIGKDGLDIAYSGDSMVIDYKGEHLVDMQSEAISPTIALDMVQQNTFRERFQFLKDQDLFEINL